MRIAYRALGVCAGLAVLAGPAAALESLTGIYEAKLSCNRIDGGAKSKRKAQVQMAIVDQGGGALLIDFDDLQAGEGYAVTETPKPERGAVSGIACTLLPGSIDGWTLRADAKVKAGSDQASLKGTLIVLDEAAQVSEICKVKAKRITPIGPKLMSCPVV